MSTSAHFSCHAPIFQGKTVPEKGTIVGYSAIIQKLGLRIPMPSQIALVCLQNKRYQTPEWNVLPNSYLPDDHKHLSEIEALYKQLVFSLKYEGINLLFFSFLAKHYSQDQLTELVSIEPTGQYSRRIWFLLEWILKKPFSTKKDLTKKSYVPLVNENLQYTIEGVRSSRHLIINNLPGTPDFCPLIFKTKKLEDYIASKLSEREKEYLKGISKDILQRASAFLLLKDSKASFTIEGESPRSKRAARWGQAIGQAGSNDLSEEEFIRLQQIVIENPRFIDIGYRKKGGFVGEHDRTTGEPIPDHISARWQDIEVLIKGLLETNSLLLRSNMDPVLIAASIAFGFVFIHPLQDGNGRLHRYLIHHILAKKQFSKQGIIFPISASILDHIVDYQIVLEDYSHPLLDFIEWKETPDHNVEVTNDTKDYYRYYDATKQAEFLYDCVEDTVQNIIPKEVAYLQNYDDFKRYVADEYEMPDKMISVLARFLEQNEGKLSQRARKKEFIQLSNEETLDIEKKYKEFFILKS